MSDIQDAAPIASAIPSDGRPRKKAKKTGARWPLVVGVLLNALIGLAAGPATLQSTLRDTGGSIEGAHMGYALGGFIGASIVPALIIWGVLFALSGSLRVRAPSGVYLLLLVAAGAALPTIFFLMAASRL